jgi:hypothetical protein
LRQGVAVVLPEPPVRGVRGEGDGPMITRQPYKSAEAQPVIHYEIEVGGKPLARNQLVTLERGIGYPAGKYRFQYAEDHRDGWCLVFFGPVARSKQRYRQVWERWTDQVRTIHRPVGRPEDFGADA